VWQVLLNLLSNARKYSPDGGPIEVSARAQPESDAVEVCVADEGLGIPAEALPRLFGEFYRVQTPDRRKIAGTGLGLSICRKIIRAHQGEIWAESEGPGTGSRFRFTLPVVTPDES
jgi:signal transduction histidine kinase